MKHSLLVLMACLTMHLAVTGQLRKIPSEVTNAFATKYPDARDVEWKDNLSNFIAKFILPNNNKCLATFNSKGEWQLSEEKLDEAQLPPSVKDGFTKSRYADRQVSEIIKIEKKDGELRFRILVKKSGLEKKYLYFDSEGKLMKEAMTI